MGLVDGGDYTCAEVLSRTSNHLTKVDTKIRDLSKMRGTLKKMISKRSGGQVRNCPIIDDLLVV